MSSPGGMPPNKHPAVPDGAGNPNHTMQEDTPENVVEFKAQEPKEPEFVLAIPMPRPPHIQKIMDELELKPADEKSALMKDIENFYRDLYFAAASMKELAAVPESMQKLSPALLQIIHAFVPREFKKFHFDRGFRSLPEETQKEVLAEQRRVREEAMVYAHLPAEGATLGDGTKVSVEQLKDMVDQGLLPPNPALGIKPRKPDVDATQKVLSIERPTEIIKP